MSDENFRAKAAHNAEILVPGRPKRATDGRLQLLGSLIAGGTKVNSVVRFAMPHGEPLTLGPFGDAIGVTAHACSVLATITGGLDPRGLRGPEAWWHPHRDEYRAKAAAFAKGGSKAMAE